MKIKKFLLFTALSFFSFFEVRSNFLPENFMQLENKSLSSFKNQREESINSVSSKLMSTFQTHIPDDFRLRIRLYWDDPTMNATPWKSDRDWGVSIYGGLLNHSRISVDALTIVMCHVLGHHFSGYPYKNEKTWMSVEGRSDYFALQSCVKKVWADDVKANQVSWDEASESNKSFCEKNIFSNQQNLCARGLTAVDNLMSVIAPSRKFYPDRLDSSHSPLTLTRHASPFCRYTTFIQGLVCNKDLQLSTPPGFDQGDQRNSKDVEQTASEVSCVSDSKELRWPRCWFQPQLKGKQTTFLAGDINRQKVSLSPGDEIQLYGQLYNASEYSYKAPKASIYNFKSPWISFEKSSTVYSQEIEPGETVVTDEPYTGFISPRAQCGMELSIPIMLEYNDFSEVSYVPLRIGNQASVFKHDMNRKYEIKDHTPVTIELDSNETAYNIEKVKLTLDIKHTAFDDLEISLVDPSGMDHLVEQTLSRAGSYGRDDIDGLVEYEVEFTKGIKNGFWKLVIEDRMSKDSGVLRGWSLEAFESQCKFNKKER